MMSFILFQLFCSSKDKDTCLVYYVCSHDFTFKRFASTRQCWGNNCIQRSNMGFVTCVELFNILLCSGHIIYPHELAFLYSTMTSPISRRSYYRAFVKKVRIVYIYFAYILILDMSAAFLLYQVGWFQYFIRTP